MPSASGTNAIAGAASGRQHRRGGVAERRWPRSCGPQGRAGRRAARRTGPADAGPQRPPAAHGRAEARRPAGLATTSARGRRRRGGRRGVRRDHERPAHRRPGSRGRRRGSRARSPPRAPGGAPSATWPRAPPLTGSTTTQPGSAAGPARGHQRRSCLAPGLRTVARHRSAPGSRMSRPAVPQRTARRGPARAGPRRRTRGRDGCAYGFRRDADRLLVPAGRVVLRPLMMALTRRDWRGAEHLPRRRRLRRRASTTSRTSTRSPSRTSCSTTATCRGSSPRSRCSGRSVIGSVICAAPSRSRCTASRRRRDAARCAAAVAAVERRRVRRDLPGGDADPRPRPVADAAARPARRGSRWTTRLPGDPDRAVGRAGDPGAVRQAAAPAAAAHEPASWPARRSTCPVRRAAS